MCNINRELRLSVLSAATKARQHANSHATRHKNVGPETLSADDDVSTSSALPVAMLAEDDDTGDLCRMTPTFVVSDAREMTSLLTTPKPIRRQSDESVGHDAVIPLADTRNSAMTSYECVYYSQCPQTDDDATRETD